MPKRCKDSNHLWTVKTKKDILMPDLDLVPGRRCLCGIQVIVSIYHKHGYDDYLQVAPIYSQEAKDFAKANPALKTW